MELLPLKSGRLESGSDLLQEFQNALKLSGQSLKNGDILVIASKVLAYSQGKLADARDRGEFRKLVKKEADRVLEDGDMIITLKNKVLIPNAGIDNSNTPKGKAILWPDDPFGSARDIRKKLEKKFGLKKLGILISDSHCQPLRLGTSGIAIGWSGFIGVQDVRGTKDLYGKKMSYTQIALADDLASAANILMGETNASTPFVIVRDAPISFSDKKFSEKDYFISPNECIYRNFYSKDLKKCF